MERVSRNNLENLEQQIKESCYRMKDSPVEFISTGSSILNMAAAQDAAQGGWARGRIVNIVGDKSTGKTLLALETCHWAYRNLPKIESKYFPKVKKVEIDFNSVEGVLDFPVASMYGKDFDKAINRSRTRFAEEAGRYCLRRMREQKKGTAIIHVIDSWDALIPEVDAELFDESIEKDKPMDDTYGLGKQAFGSQFFFKSVADEIDYNKKDFTLFLISQVRDRIGVTFGEKKKRAGGAALDFYSHQICWLYERSKIERTAEGEKRAIGLNIEGYLKKNKTAKPYRKGNACILFDYGVDDITSMVDYYFGPKAESFIIGDMDKPYKQKEPFINFLINNNMVDVLQGHCQEKWSRIEEKIKVERPPKF